MLAQGAKWYAGITEVAVPLIFTCKAMFPGAVMHYEFNLARCINCNGDQHELLLNPSSTVVFTVVCITAAFARHRLPTAPFLHSNLWHEDPRSKFRLPRMGMSQ